MILWFLMPIIDDLLKFYRLNDTDYENNVF
ncbi:hypothetical protein SAMN06265220_101615 [Flavobacterium nitrogenifigens]|uniref:Uncharacterized protein n=1 Tax=Flavobacterium nitrogenifigens TaxID=1617283 RepID=A0A521B2S1_9FLAO|nr:hypothetical protein SAMN06265220_101615 [Flavobacterium nitrogenifigens]